jgi:nucleoid-associated protein EbfC
VRVVVGELLTASRATWHQQQREISVFKGLGNLGQLGTFMKQAQEMGSKMQAVAERLKEKRATGAAGGGLVEVDVNGLGDVLAVRLDATLVEKQDREMLEDLLPAAFNAAHAKAKQLHAEAIGEITGGANLPGFEEAMSQLTGGGA